MMCIILSLIILARPMIIRIAMVTMITIVVIAMDTTCDIMMVMTIIINNMFIIIALLSVFLLGRLLPLRLLLLPHMPPYHSYNADPSSSSSPSSPYPPYYPSSPCDPSPCSSRLGRPSKGNRRRPKPALRAATRLPQRGPPTAGSTAHERNEAWNATVGRGAASPQAEKVKATSGDRGATSRLDGQGGRTTTGVGGVGVVCSRLLRRPWGVVRMEASTNKGWAAQVRSEGFPDNRLKAGAWLKVAPLRATDAPRPERVRPTPASEPPAPM